MLNGKSFVIRSAIYVGWVYFLEHGLYMSFSEKSAIYWGNFFRPRPIIVHSRPQTTIHYHYYVRPSYLPPVLPRGCGGRCGRHAFCWRGHTCLCRKGYKGNPLRRCYPGEKSLVSIIKTPRLTIESS